MSTYSKGGRQLNTLASKWGACSEITPEFIVTVFSHLSSCCITVFLSPHTCMWLLVRLRCHGSLFLLSLTHSWTSGTILTFHICSYFSAFCLATLLFISILLHWLLSTQKCWLTKFNNYCLLSKESVIRALLLLLYWLM